MRHHKSSQMSRARGARANPLVRYRAEKGPPVRRDSRWIDLSSGDDVSNTTWEGGVVDFSGASPRVFVGPGRRAALPSRGRRVITYLLHPDKWSGDVRSAAGMIPNVSSGPGSPAAYGLRVRYDVPVRLYSGPERPKNPRAWFEARGVAVGERVVGHATISTTGKRVPVYREVVVGEAPGRGVRLLNPTKAQRRRELARGMRVEREHDDVTGGDPRLVRRIVLAHLRERPDYYRRLARCVENPARSAAQRRLFGAALGCRRARGGTRRRACRSTRIRRLARLPLATLRAYARRRRASRSRK